VERSWGADFGRYVRVRHSDRMETVYAHLTRFAKPLEIGQAVTTDEVIGYVGSTGRSTGPHVHFEVRRAGKPIDPLAKPVRAQPERKSKQTKAKGEGS
jgi:murein DD-endopeptidase MepM/ murein hydrolase activator NlpD